MHIYEEFQISRDENDTCHVARRQWCTQRWLAFVMRPLKSLKGQRPNGPHDEDCELILFWHDHSWWTYIPNIGKVRLATSKQLKSRWLKKHDGRTTTYSNRSWHQGVLQKASGIKQNVINSIVSSHFITMKRVNVPPPSHHCVVPLPCKKHLSTILWQISILRKRQLKCIIKRTPTYIPRI